MNVISPSYRRPKTVSTHNIIQDVVYAVHSFEMEEYKANNLNVIELPDNTKGNIAKVRNYIKRKYEKEGDLLIIDDDIKNFLYWKNGKQIKLAHDDLMEHIELMFMLAKEWGVSLFGVNPARDKGSYREYTPFSTKSYISGSFNGFISCPCYFDEKIPLKEDYDLTIQVCNVERKVLRFNLYSLNKADHKNKGGCAQYRTIEREKEQFSLLQKKWGNKIVRKDNVSKEQYDINPIINIPINGV